MTAPAVPRGLTEAGRAAVETLFREHLERRWHPGAQLAVYRDGALVLDLAGGEADRGRPLEADARMLYFSSTKPIMAVGIHIAADRGLLDYDSPIAHYWPAFAAGGKERATVRHALAHQAGCPQLPPDFDWGQVHDWEYTVSRTAEIPAAWMPGTAIGYHTLTYGWILGEVLRLVDGRMPCDFMRDEIFRPLGIEHEVSLGLEDDEVDLRVPVKAMSEVTRRDPKGKERSTSKIVQAFNQSSVARAQAPAVNCYGTARALGKFYAMLLAGGTLEGASILRPETVARASQPQGETARDRSQDVPKRYGLGFYVSGYPGDPFDYHDGPGVFGHAGQQSSVGYADPRYGLAVAYITNGLHEPDIVYRRMAEMSRAIRDACE